jgi:nucleoside-diphosphate-sugar epimerase
MNWKSRPVLVTGGASFIGSHLVGELVERGAAVRVVDDLSSGQMANIQEHVDAGRVEFIRGDLKVNGLAKKAVDGISVVFHLAADHGGRGYVELHQSACALNMTLDQLVFDAAARGRVDKVVFASSGCVYPNDLQTDPTQTVYLTEDIVGPPYDADNMYGWAKLMGEMTLRAYCKDWGSRRHPAGTSPCTAIADTRITQ